MMNKSMVLCIYLVTGLLLYDLIFDISWLLSPQVHYIVLLVMAALHAHAVLAVTSLTFPSLSKLPCSLYIPSESYKEKTAHPPWALHVHDLFLSQNMDVPEMVVSFIVYFFHTVQSKTFPKRLHVKPLYFYFSLDIYYHYTYFPVLLECTVQDLLKTNG